MTEIFSFLEKNQSHDALCSFKRPISTHIYAFGQNAISRFIFSKICGGRPSKIENTAFWPIFVHFLPFPTTIQALYPYRFERINNLRNGNIIL